MCGDWGWSLDFGNGGGYDFVCSIGIYVFCVVRNVVDWNGYVVFVFGDYCWVCGFVNVVYFEGFERWMEVDSVEDGMFFFWDCIYNYDEFEFFFVVMG